MSPVIIPTGATVTFSAPRVVVDQDGERSIQVTITDGSVQAWPDWLAISLTRMEEAGHFRKHMTAAIADGASQSAGAAMMTEYQACLQSISAAVFALDAFYGVIQGMITIPETAAQDSRAASVTDAIIRASARLPNDVGKALKANIRAAYKLRDRAVHPPHREELFAVHPELNAQVPQRYIDYSLETSRRMARWAIDAITWPVDHPRPRNPALAAWAPIASEILHRIIDPFQDRLPPAD